MSLTHPQIDFFEKTLEVRADGLGIPRRKKNGISGVQWFDIGYVVPLLRSLTGQSEMFSAKKCCIPQS